jgi:hypothetical protein
MRYDLSVKILNYPRISKWGLSSVFTAFRTPKGYANNIKKSFFIKS